MIEMCKMREVTKTHKASQAHYKVLFNASPPTKFAGFAIFFNISDAKSIQFEPQKILNKYYARV